MSEDGATRKAGRSSSPRAKPSPVAGRYKIVRTIGAGGMGRVYVAEDMVLRREVALKIIKPEFGASPTFAERFRREGQIAARIGHPNVVQVHDMGVTDDGVLYLVMELLEGQDLLKTVRDKGPLGVDETVGILGQVLFALAAAHRAGIVHRDLKPSNIFLSHMPVGRLGDLEEQTGPDGNAVTVKLLDFGISRVSGTGISRLTTAGEVMGSDRYMAPEQVEDTSAVDHRADLYSVGIIAYECLTGQNPFPAEDVGAALRRMLNPTPPDPCELCAGLPVGLGAVVQKALGVHPDERYQSAEELIEALRPFHVSAGRDGGRWAGLEEVDGVVLTELEAAETEMSGSLVAVTPPPPEALDIPPTEPLQARTEPMREGAMGEMSPPPWRAPDAEDSADLEMAPARWSSPDADEAADMEGAESLPDDEPSSSRRHWIVALAIGSLAGLLIAGSVVVAGRASRHRRVAEREPLPASLGSARPAVEARPVPLDAVPHASAPAERSRDAGAPGALASSRGAETGDASVDAAEPEEQAREDPLAQAQRCADRGGFQCCLRALRDAPQTREARRLRGLCQRGLARRRDAREADPRAGSPEVGGGSPAAAPGRPEGEEPGPRPPRSGGDLPIARDAPF